MDANEPQRCIKCHKIPEDILMLACSHDLCLDCAAERLSFELKKKKTANSIVCEICYERTPLDPESIGELEKLIVPAKPTPVAKSYADPKVNQNERFERVAARVAQDDRTNSKPYERQPARDYGYSGSQANNNSSSRVTAGISTRKECGEHPDEDILYFCFDCKCECICPECVIHGKHKDHDVKTLKKAHPLIKGELEAYLDKIETAVENLLVRKSEVEKNIRHLNDQNNQSKGQIQKAFEEVRNALAIKEKELLAKCDSTLEESLEELEKGVRTIIKRIEDLKGFSGGISESLKKEELFVLNFYAKKWKEMGEEVKDSQIVVPQVAATNHERTLSSILEATDYVGRIKLAGGKEAKEGYGGQR